MAACKGRENLMKLLMLTVDLNRCHNRVQGLVSVPHSIAIRHLESTASRNSALCSAREELAVPIELLCGKNLISMLYSMSLIQRILHITA
jgi:hypothetical protein